MTAQLAGKIAVVTGGGSGLGLAMGRTFARAGMALAVLDIDASAARRAADDLAAQFGVPTTSAGVDIGDADAVTAAARHVEQTLGGCDLLCANVGVQQFGAIDRLTDEDWEWVLNINVLGTVRTVRAFLPMIRARNGWRRILLTASSSALIPGVRLGAYVTSKFAVQGFGETLRMELADEGIGVSVLFPDAMSTRHLESSAQARPADLGEWVLMPDDIDVMLASRPASLGSQVATAEHAARNVLAELEANRPYIITHGDYRAQFRQRTAALESAFDRMDQADPAPADMVAADTTAAADGAGSPERLFATGRVALVTGIGPGMGRSIALAFARAGVDVVLAARRAERLEAVAAEIRALGREPLVVPTDITDPDACRRLVAAAVERFGGIDVLIQNGHHEGDWTPVVDADPESWREIFEVNLFGALHLVQAVVPVMRARGGGSVILVNSGAAVRTPVSMGAYSTSKSALAALARTLALEVGRWGIRVNGVFLGPVLGENLERMGSGAAAAAGSSLDEWLKTKATEMPLGLVPSADQCAGTVLFLASDLASVVTGQHVAVNGGQWLT
jgi:NAD(P)-dependent dehydrogenase (short-subunit alcohol dehydrogenase family)